MYFVFFLFRAQLFDFVFLKAIEYITKYGESITRSLRTLNDAKNIISRDNYLGECGNYISITTFVWQRIYLVDGLTAHTPEMDCDQTVIGLPPVRKGRGAILYFGPGHHKSTSLSSLDVVKGD
jgi:hypothetical protein